MKGNLNPEGERICPPLGKSNEKPDQGLSDFQAPNLMHINARAPGVSDAAAKLAVAGVIKMDERMKELVAMGAAAAANCHPCMDHHLAKCDELGVSREQVAEAVKVGLIVNHGAERGIRKKARELLGESMIEAA